jgi:NAD+ diphosphatase
MPRPSNAFASGALDRKATQRGDAAWLAALRKAPETRLVPVWRNRTLVQGEENLEAVWISAHSPEVADFGDPAEIWRFLGEWQSANYFTLDLSHLDEPPWTEVGRFEDLRQVGLLLPEMHGAICAYARGLNHWHRHAQFCSKCGTATRSTEAGHQRACTNPDCDATHFPRTDPAVIMLIHHGDQVVLGRQTQWPLGMHSILAGFVEPGESLENAVAREVMEEVGIEIETPEYHSSQPWPFPASIMLGFSAQARTTKLQVQLEELESAHWVSRSFLQNSPEDETFRLPRKDSIARRILEDWMAERL